MTRSEALRTMLAASACLLVSGTVGWWMRGDSVPPIVAVNAPHVSEKDATPFDAHAAAAARESSTDEASNGDAKNFATAIRAALDDSDELARGICTYVISLHQT